MPGLTPPRGAFGRVSGCSVTPPLVDSPTTTVRLNLEETHPPRDVASPGASHQHHSVRLPKTFGLDPTAPVDEAVRSELSFLSAWRPVAAIHVGEPFAGVLEHVARCVHPTTMQPFVSNNWSTIVGVDQFPRSCGEMGRCALGGESIPGRDNRIRAVVNADPISTQAVADQLEADADECDVRRVDVHCQKQPAVIELGAVRTNAPIHQCAESREKLGLEGRQRFVIKLEELVVIHAAHGKGSGPRPKTSVMTHVERADRHPDVSTRRCHRVYPPPVARQDRSTSAR